MKTKYQIQFDYHNAIEQAKKLEDLAARIESQVVNRMNDVAGDLHAAWKSESANRYIGKEQALAEQIKTTARELRDTAMDIRRIAKRMYEAEMLALRIAQDRNS